MEENIINFYSEDVSFNLENQDEYKNWLILLANNNHKAIGNINYIFCSDQYLLDINKTYLDHDTLTDIITFPYSYDPIESDIYISINRIEENAQTFNVTNIKELSRVMAHGLLHLIGYNDKTEEDQAEMKEQENTALELKQSIFNTL